MAPDILLHPPRRMRRIVRDTKVSSTLIESRFECQTCHRSVWRELDSQRQRTYLCDGQTVATVLPMAAPQGPPSQQDLIDLLREILRSNLHPLLRVRIIGMVRRLKEK